MPGYSCANPKLFLMRGGGTGGDRSRPWVKYEVSEISAVHKTGTLRPTCSLSIALSSCKRKLVSSSSDDRRQVQARPWQQGQTAFVPPAAWHLAQ